MQPNQEIFVVNKIAEPTKPATKPTGSTAGWKALSPGGDRNFTAHLSNVKTEAKSKVHFARLTPSVLKQTVNFFSAHSMSTPHPAAHKSTTAKPLSDEHKALLQFKTALLASRENYVSTTRQLLKPDSGQSKLPYIKLS